MRLVLLEPAKKKSTGPSSENGWPVADLTFFRAAIIKMPALTRLQLAREEEVSRQRVITIDGRLIPSIPHCGQSGRQPTTLHGKFLHRGFFS
jgi:hypothetical protein